MEAVLRLMKEQEARHKKAMAEMRDLLAAASQKKVQKKQVQKKQVQKKLKKKERPPQLGGRHENGPAWGMKLPPEIPTMVLR